MHQPEIDKGSPLYRRRHTLAHVLAQAMQAHRPGALLGFGPPVEDGFYYDFILPEPVTEEDLPRLEALMRDILVQGQELRREELPAEAALARLEAMKEPHKVEYARELIDGRGLRSLTFYTNGPFVDMCEGPHVANTRDIPPDCFKLSSIAGAYWRGDERRQMMTRIYGWAFDTAQELQAYEKARREALERDHRKLGAELDLFVIDDDVGKGLALWLPNGEVLCQELEKLAEEEEFRDGYQRVRTPHITKGRLYEISGHLSLYKGSMYPPMQIQEDEGGETTAYYLKPMNCPHHHKLFAARPRSYRDLPLRLAEYGAVYRYERSGTLQGLTRVRGMTMNDAHIYVREDQARDELIRVMDLHRRYYALFGFSDYHLRLSLWDPDDPKKKEKYVDDPAGWAAAEERIRDALRGLGLPWVEAKGEAAFYGPKIDIQFRTVGQKEFTVSTNQLDFAIARRFVEAGVPMVYKDKDDALRVPCVIHRAPLGTHERFVSFLIEHYGGAFPTWLAPVQVRVLPVSQKFRAYADKVCAAFRERLIRAEVDPSDEKLGKKVALGVVRKVPVLLVVGGNEQRDETATVRRYGVEEQRTLKLREVVEQVSAEIRARRHVRSWADAAAP